LHDAEKQGRYMDLKIATKLLVTDGFATKVMTPTDHSRFGNWELLAVRAPLAIRVTNDRGVVLDLMQWDEFQAGANESDWFNWDVVARALDILEDKGGSLSTLLLNLGKIEEAFYRPNWPKTKDLLHKIEAEKRREFMGGARLRAHA
jgi:hypothetical protein